MNPQHKLCRLRNRLNRCLSRKLYLMHMIETENQLAAKQGRKLPDGDLFSAQINRLNKRHAEILSILTPVVS